MNIGLGGRAGSGAGDRKVSRSLRVADAFAWLLLLILGWAGLVGRSDANPLPFADRYADRGLLEGTSGSGEGQSGTATLEAGEPGHAGRVVDRSLWVSWVAPAHGLAEFWTDGSKFDTVLAVYAEESALGGLGGPGGGGGNPFAGLREVAAQDDGEDLGALHSRVRFPVRAGVRYEVAVSGYAGASGEVVLAWNFQETPFELPVLLHRETDRTVVLGTGERMAFEVRGGVPALFQWTRNGQALAGETRPILDLASMGPLDVGTYALRVRVPSPGEDDDDEVEFTTRTLELQIGPERSEILLARDKVFGWSENGATGTRELQEAGNELGRRAGGGRLMAVGGGVTRGFSGTQIFDTTTARRDPGEPNHCGLPGGASYWYRYTPPSDGRLEVDTLGSSFDTILAVYTYSVPVRGYGDLVEVACNDDEPGAGGRSRAVVSVSGLRPYLVVVDGKNGARGNAWLRWKLSAAASRLRVTRIDRSLVLSYPTVPGSGYVLETSAVMGGVWLPVLTNVATGLEWAPTQDLNSGPERYFRIQPR